MSGGGLLEIQPNELKFPSSGGYAFSSATDATDIIESSSGSSPGEGNISSYPCEAGTSGFARDFHDDATNTSRSPTPPVMPITGGSGSGQSSGSKRAKSQERRPTQTTSIFGRRKKKDDRQGSSMADMVELGYKKLALITQLVEKQMRQSQEKPSIHTCMQRVYGMSGIGDEHILTIVDAFKDEGNRDSFMALQDEHARNWIDRLIAQNIGIYRQYFPGL